MVTIVCERTCVCDWCGRVCRDKISFTSILDAATSPPLPTGWRNCCITLCPKCVLENQKEIENT